MTENSLQRGVPKTMSRTIELSDETHKDLVELAQQQNKTPEDVIRQILTEYQAETYRQANEQMLAQGILASLPIRFSEEDDDEPETLPGKPLSEIILEERR